MHGMKLSRHGNRLPRHIKRLPRHDNMLPTHFYCSIDKRVSGHNKYLYGHTQESQ
jgi:hypothetical protein